ncbi:hypothetical protein [Falsiroseomonas sp. HW251]
MRYVFGIALLALTGLAGCAQQQNQGGAPCIPPMAIDVTGNCVNVMERRR